MIGNLVLPVEGFRGTGQARVDGLSAREEPQDPPLAAEGAFPGRPGLLVGGG